MLGENSGDDVSVNPASPDMVDFLDEQVEEETEEDSDDSVPEVRRSSRIPKRKGIFTYDRIGGKPSVDVIQ